MVDLEVGDRITTFVRKSVLCIFRGSTVCKKNVQWFLLAPLQQLRYPSHSKKKKWTHKKTKQNKNSNICLVKKIITTEKQQERKLQRGKFPDLCVGSKHLNRRLSAAMLPLLPLDRFPLTHPLTRKPQYVGGGVLLPNLKYQWGCQINKGMEATGYTRPGKR